MATTFVLITVGGLAIGLWFRANALAAVSVVVLVVSISYNAVSNRDFLDSAVISFGLVATLQAGYLFGLVLGNFVRNRREFA